MAVRVARLISENSHCFFIVSEVVVALSHREMNFDSLDSNRTGDLTNKVTTRIRLSKESQKGRSC